MLFTENLSEIVFSRHEHIDCDEMIVLSGYVGPNPVARLADLPLNTTIVYGMYPTDGVRQQLHNSLT